MENFPTLAKEIDFQEGQEAQRVPKKLDPRKHTPRHIINYPRLKIRREPWKQQEGKRQLPYFSDYMMHFFPQIWEETGGASSECSFPGLLGWWGGSGAGSQEAGAGSPLQEASGKQGWVMLLSLGWEGQVSWRCKAREAGAESLLQHAMVLGRRV